MWLLVVVVAGVRDKVREKTSRDVNKKIKMR